MATQFNYDMTFLNLQEYVLRELKEPASVGSEAVPTDLVKDVLNAVYAEAFNDQRMKQTARENNVTFTLANDTTLNGDLVSGAVTIPVTDSSTFRSLGRVLVGNNMADYTSNAANTLSGVTGVTTIQTSGTLVRQMYSLVNVAPTIQDEQIQYLDINGIPQQYLIYDNLITQVNFVPNTYTVYKGFLLFSKQATLASSNPATVLMTFGETVVPMTASGDKPTLIPNSFRVAVLVYGACMKIAAADAYKTSWDWWKAEYEKALSQYVAFKNNRVKMISNKKRPTVWDNYGLRG